MDSPCPGPAFSRVHASAIRATKRSATARSTYTTSIAPQACPALHSAQWVMPATVRSRSQSATTIAGSLPPISALQGMPSWAQRSWTFRPLVVEPVKTQASGRASSSAAPTSGPPFATCTTPGGRCAASSSANHPLDRGEYSLGLRTTALPERSAGNTER